MQMVTDKSNIKAVKSADSPSSERIEIKGNKCQQIMHAVDSCIDNPTDDFDPSSASAASSTKYVETITSVVDRLIQKKKSTCTCTTVHKLVPMIVHDPLLVSNMLVNQTVLQETCNRVENVTTLPVTREQFKDKLVGFLTMVTNELPTDHRECGRAVVLQSLLLLIHRHLGEKDKKHWATRVAATWAMQMNILFKVVLSTPPTPP